MQENLFYSYPEYLTYFYDNSGFIRYSWKKYLKKVSTQKCATILLRNSLIPKAEIKEFIENCVHLNNDSLPKDDDFAFLSTYGYRDLIDEILIKATTEKFSFDWWIKENPKFIKFYIKQNFIEHNSLFFDNLLKNFDVPNHSKKNEEIIYSALSSIISEIPEFMDYIKGIAENLSFDLDNILFLF